MASSFMTPIVPSFMFFCLLLLAGAGQLSARPIHKAVSTNDLVADECKRTENATLCQEIVKRTGAANATDLLTLATTMIRFATIVDTETGGYIGYLVNRTKDPALWTTYRGCGISYATSYGAQKQALEYLGKHDYKNASVMASDILKLTKDCGAALSQHGPGSPHPDQSKLPKMNKYFLAVSGVIDQMCRDLKEH